MKTKILWLSKSTLAPLQLTSLEEKFGEIEVTHISSLDSPSDIPLFVTLSKYYDVIALALPQDMLYDLVSALDKEKIIVWPSIKKMATGRTITNPQTKEKEKEYKMISASWIRLQMIES